MQSKDYKDRTYLSSIEAAKFLDISVESLHELVNDRLIKSKLSASGQKRFELLELNRYQKSINYSVNKTDLEIERVNEFDINGTTQKLYVTDAAQLSELQDNSVHLMVTSPPYFDTKMYSRKPIRGDLGNIHDVDEWFKRIGKVWAEVYRVLQPGRKCFINIMNLPIRLPSGGYRTLNLSGRTIDLCEGLGFIFKRDIVWQKTNAVKAHFGTYPYPGGILINNMHEFILEFDKPQQKGYSKYGHLTRAQKEESKMDKEFWLSLKKSDVWLMAPQGSGDRRDHVAPFPYELPFRLIKAFSYVGETILDPFVGSGTTLFAASDLKRNGIGYELNPEIAGQVVQKLKDYAKTSNKK